MSSLLSRKIRETGFSFESYDLFLVSPREKNTTKCCIFYMFCLPLQRERKFMGLFCDSFCDGVCGVLRL